MDSWDDVSVKHEGPAIDEAEVRKALQLLVDPALPFEIRAVSFRQKGHGTICTSIDEGVQAVLDYSKMKSIWLCLNPLKPSSPRANKRNVERRIWMLIDIDVATSTRVPPTMM